MVKFGVKIVQSGYSYEEIRSLCLEAERAGFDSFWVADHMYSWGRKPTEAIALESTTTLSSLAVLTKNIRLGTLVICNLFRHPAVLAKMTSSLDVISGGRLELGIGAGGPSTPIELGGYGMSFPRRTERIERLAESIEILKSMWTEPRTNFDGKHYKLKDVINSPKPVQKPYPRIWVGGERRDILQVAAKHANGWNCRRLDIDTFRQKVGVLNSVCSENKRAQDALAKSWQGSILVAKDVDELDEKKKKYGIEQGAMVGTCEQLVATIQQYVDAGASYFMFHFQDDKELRPLSLFAEKVAPNI